LANRNVLIWIRNQLGDIQLAD